MEQKCAQFATRSRFENKKQKLETIMVTQGKNYI